jgi:hypothetical protein
MHDGRLLTLEDTVEFFNLIIGTKLTANEKEDLVAFLRTLSLPVTAAGDLSPTRFQYPTLALWTTKGDASSRRR